jgi:glutathione S-transferase
MLEELGRPFELVPTRFDSGETRTPDFLALNPNGHVPTLVDGSLVLWESLAINLYLAERYDAHGRLWPKDASARAECTKWSFFAMGELEGPTDAAAKRHATLEEGWLDRPLAALEQRLLAHEWLAAPHFSVADLNVASLFWRPRIRTDMGEGRDSVNRWLDACAARPAFVRMSARSDDA